MKFSAKTCPDVDLIDITTVKDALENKRVYICGNHRCLHPADCNTVVRKTIITI